MIFEDFCNVWEYSTGERVLVTSTLRCKKVHVSVGPARSSDERRELAAIRKLYFDPTFNMPETAQVQIVGETDMWNTIPGTFAILRGAARVPRYKRCDVVRAI